MKKIRKIALHSETFYDNIGNKASFLQRLWMAGIRVPRGYVLTNEFLRELLCENEVNDRFTSICTEPVVINRSQKLKKIIMSLEFPDEMISEIHSVLEEFVENVIVRSSSDNEDTSDKSMAGLYLSIDGVNTVEKLKNAILECFASAYSQAIFSIRGEADEEMSIIIQEYVPARCAGVAFTINPIDMNAHEIYINYGSNAVGITDGSSNGNVVCVNKVSPSNLSHTEYPEQFKELCEILLKAEKMFGCYIDCEWLLNESGIVILQVRPVTGTESKEEIRNVINLDNIWELNGVNLGRLSVANDKWFAKKYYVRKLCLERTIPVYAARYIYLSEDKKQRMSAVQEAKRSFTTRYVEGYDGTTYTVIDVNEIENFCENAYASSGCGYIRVCEYWIGNYCGYATVTAENSVYIETIKGSFYGMWVGGLIPSYYEVTSEGEVVKKFESELPFYYRMSQKTFKYEKYQLKEPVIHVLTESDLRTISDICRELRSKLGDVNIEWLGTDDGIRVFDLSEDTVSSVGRDCMANVLARGHAEGELVFINDLSSIEGLFDNVINDIDVVPTAKYLKTIESDECKSVVKQLLGHAHKPIVVADFPSRSLAVMCDYVSGFIFRRGAVLCHLSIILREKAIPAVICPEIDEMASKDDTVSIIGGRLIFKKSELSKIGHEIIIEGTCCTGKTRIIEKLRESGRYEILDENIAVADYGVRDIESVKTSLERDLYFLGMDMAKWDIIREKSKLYDVLVERCSLGTLSITYSSAEYSSNLSSLITVLLERIKKGDVPVPDAYIYVTKRVDILEEHFRADIKNRRISHWNNIDAFIRQDEFLKEYFNYQTAVPTLCVENNNLEEAVLEVNCFIKEILENGTRPDKKLFGEELSSFLEQYISR